MRKKTVSLSSELHLVARALDGIRLLSEQWKELHFNEDDLPRVAHALHAVSVLVRERLLLLDHGVRDTIDPRLLVCEENRALEGASSDDGDVVLRPWSTKKSAERLRRAADRAERRLASLQDRRKEGSSR
ncbi:MAG: hypothetical protein U0270_16875 [Labilithrix sp.]